MYGKIKDMRRCNLQVNRNGELIYSGMVEDAPKEIKNLNYKEIKLESGLVILEV